MNTSSLHATTMAVISRPILTETTSSTLIIAACIRYLSISTRAPTVVSVHSLQLALLPVAAVVTAAYLMAAYLMAACFMLATLRRYANVADWPRAQL